ncbi:MAG: C39 family peptidase [Methylacidiphilales bacterium]|nr:C39 family peptidase [Candidatus Methylacidiphilales bacterium]MDW8349633.1 C39 family peptidase [Verrucomicrobiae bacterium]
MIHELWLSFYIVTGSLGEYINHQHAYQLQVMRWEWPQNPLTDPAFWSQDARVWLRTSRFFTLIEKNKNRETWRSEDFLPWLGYETVETKLVLDQGKPINLHINVINRGDLRVLEASQKALTSMVKRFERMDEFLNNLVQKMTHIMEVDPSKEEDRVARGVKVSGFVWKKNFVWARLNYNRGEFITFELTPPGVELDAIENAFMESQIATTGNLREIRKEDLIQNVVNEPDGSLWINNIPMVDQGEKGYCTVATMERVFRYYGIPLDQHLAADLAESSALMGTRITLGIEAAEKLLKGNDLRLRPLREDNRGRLRFDRLKEVLSQGLPIIWNVDLSQSDEPGNNALGSSFAGHTRLIIGLNLDKQEIYFSDSWGVLHQKKTMSFENASRIHISAFYLEPRN